MKVQGPTRSTVSQVQDKGQVKNAQGAKVESAAGERVAVSSLSKLLAQVRAPDSPDTAKVDKLRDSIRAGAFKVDHEQVAQTMLQEEL
jgi:flagellar biosynthesis anti-sigma factor FlgM